MLLAAGHRLGHYEILTPIGAGGMGEVYRARDTLCSAARWRSRFSALVCAAMPEAICSVKPAPQRR